MALSDHVTLTITNGTTTVARAGFGIPMILSCNATAFPERIRTYTDIEGVGADFATTSPEYLAASAIFSQEPRPETIKIGRAVGVPTQAYTVAVSSAAAGNVYGIDVLGEGVTATECRYTALADLTFVDGDITVIGDIIAEVGHGMASGDGPFRLTTSGVLPTGLAADTNYWVYAATADTFKLCASKANALIGTAVDITAAGGGGTHTLARDNNDTIVAQLVQALNAVVGKNYTAVQTAGAGETDTITVTASTAGAWFSLAPTDVSLLAASQTQSEPSPTIAADLAAIRVVDDSWYMLYTLFNSEAYIDAAAAAIEPLKKMYCADISDTLAASTADGGGDLQDDLQDFNYDRTFTVFHPSPGLMCGAAWMGTRLPYEPGAATWKFAQPDGVTAVNLTSTQSYNLVTKNANFLQTTAGIDIMREGVTVGGEFIDVIRDLDWLEDDVTKSIFEALASNPKIPYTNAGVAVIEAALRGSLLRAVSRGVIDADFTISVPKVASVSLANRALRLLPDVKFTARLAGAIHKVTVTGVITV
jgi:hypothetical protein